MSFIGQFPARLDAKNRLFLPAAFRKALQAEGTVNLVIRKDFFEDCIVVYPYAKWQEEIAAVRAKLNRFDNAQQMVYRKLVSEAQEIQLDGSGRLLVPKSLLERVGISQDVLFVGMEQTIEIWAAKSANTEGDQNFMTDQAFAEELKGFMTGE